MRKRFAGTLTFLRSTTLTMWLVGLFIIYYLTMAVWVGEAFGRYMIHLSSNNLFRAYYLLFLANVTLRVYDALKRLWPERRRFLLRLPFFAGLLLLLFSLFLSLNFRKSVWLPPIGRGDVVKIPWKDEFFKVLAVEPALKKRTLRTEGSAVFDYEPGVTLQDRAGERHAVGAFPPALVGSTFMHVLTFGIAPGVQLLENGSTVRSEAVALRLVPFGAVDRFRFDPYPYEFFLSIVPNRTIKKGAETGNEYDLERPRYHVEIVQGDQVIARGDTETEISFDKNKSLSFSAPDDWVLLEIAHDPFLLWLVFGIALLCTGACLYPFSLRRKTAPESGGG